MSKTRAELINQALVNLGIIASGQSVSDQDVSKMDGIVDPAIATLARIDVYYVQDAGDLGPAGGEIEDEAFLPLADYIANAACSAFNLPADTKMQALSQIAVGTLTTIAAPPRAFRTLRIDPALRSNHRRGFGGF